MASSTLDINRVASPRSGGVVVGVCNTIFTSVPLSPTTRTQLSSVQVLRGLLHLGAGIALLDGSTLSLLAAAMSTSSYDTALASRTASPPYQLVVLRCLLRVGKQRDAASLLLDVSWLTVHGLRLPLGAA
jgi:hypothetical protein